MQTILHKAGPYEVEYLKCPHYAGPSNLTVPRTGVLHTTEGGFDGSLAIFKKHYAPHFLISDSVIAQLIPIGVSGASLKQHNNIAIVQIELVGFSKETPWFPDDESAHRLGAVMATCLHLLNLPLSHPWKDGDYGRAGDNPHRHSGFYGKVAGWYGHADTPTPDTHWDPGNLQWSELFDLAKSFSLGAMMMGSDDPTLDTGHP